MQGKLQQSYRVSLEIGQNGYFSGTLALSQLSRLSSLVIPSDVDISVQFEFVRNLYKLNSITGHIKSKLTVECQRCLEPMLHEIDQDFGLLIDATDEDVEVSQMDTVYSDEGYLNVFEVIEDELILTLPLIMMHEEKDCNAYWKSEPEMVQVEEKVNPFAVLETLKSNK